MRLIKSVNWDGETHICQVALEENDNITGKEIEKIEGATILEYVQGNGVEITEYEAKVMESGLVLHDKFFRR